MRIHFFKLVLLITLFAMRSGDLIAQVNWTKYSGNPMITAPGSWYAGALTPCVLYNADSSRFEMWFSGSAGSSGQRPWRIGYAVSSDGISWSVRSNPVLTATAGMWDSYTVEAPYVIRESGQYKMWYTGSPDFVSFSIGYATSEDGINWTKDTLHNPVFEPGTQLWELAGPGYCCVMSVSGGYKMWYTSAQANGLKEYTGYATSFDGISWERDTLNNPVLGPGAAGQWDEFLTVLPRVLYINNNYYMWYLGGRFQYSQLRGGLALSSNGITNWYKVPENPVLQPTPGQWDGTDVEIGSVVLIGDSLYMYYDGRGSRWQIGIAKCHFEPVSVEQETIQPTAFLLEQNYPNPFNSATAIQYSILQRGNVVLKVYGILGNEVVTLVNKEKDQGVYTINFDANNLASGLYLYRIQAGSFIDTKKMILLK